MGSEFEVNKAELDVMRLLLFRWERDLASLADYLLPEEQRSRLLYMEVALKRHLVQKGWSAVSAAYIAATYKKTLEYRLANPKAFEGRPEHQHE